MNLLNRVQTVLGEVSADELGHCQCHEHLFLAKGRSAEIHPALFIDDFEKSTAEVMDYKKLGGNSIVDAQPIGCGRMADQLLAVSQKTGVHMIASTGFHKLIFYWDDHWIHKFDDEQLAAIFIQEYQNGMFVGADRNELFSSNQTQAKAGIIKTAVDSKGISNEYRKLFEAAAEASIQTGLSIHCHIEKDSDPFQVYRFFSDRGIVSESIILCHLDRTHHDIGIHRELAQTGVFLEYDTIGRTKYHSDRVEAGLIQKMIEHGFADQLLISLDTTRDRLVHYGGNIGLGYILQSFIPLLKVMGISELDILKMTAKNAQKALAIKQLEGAE